MCAELAGGEDAAATLGHGNGRSGILVYMQQCRKAGRQAASYMLSSLSLLKDAGPNTR